MARRYLELGLAAAFVILHLAGPFLFQERYPFTVAPMFRDQPSQYCLYEVCDPDGNRLDESDFGLHLVYDGNPPGLGTGIEPKPTLHDFGMVADRAAVVAKVKSCLQECEFPFVTVHQKHAFCRDGKVVEQVHQWKVAR